MAVKFILPDGMPPDEAKGVVEAVTDFAQQTAGRICARQAVVVGLMIAVAALLEDGDNGEEELKEKLEYANGLLDGLFSNASAQEFNDTEH